MFSREFARVTPKGIPAPMRKISPTSAKRHLERHGWSQRQAARHLNRCYQHVNQVLNGARESRALLEALASLPPAKDRAVTLDLPNGLRVQLGNTKANS